MSEMNETKIYRLEEVQKHHTESSVWVVVHDVVYDLTNFLDEHPGGEAILLENAGKIATENFDDVGHSSGALELMKDYRIGELHEDEKQNTSEPKQWEFKPIEEGSSWWKAWVFPLSIAIAATIAFRAYYN